MIKFSCLCVTYGRNEYIGEAVYSFLNQSYENKELIILNTCPRQEYVFEHPLVKVINLKERPESHCMAMHMSVLESSGDWLIPWDDDDIWLPEFISQYARHVEKDPNLGWIQAYGRYFSNIDKLVAYTPMGTYNHLFTVSRKLYDKVGGYINKSKTYDEDVCDLTLLNAIQPHYGLSMVNESHDSSMIYRYAGIHYHHSSKKASGKTNYEVCGEHVNRLLDEGSLKEGKIVINPIEKYPWNDMAKEIFELPPEYTILKKIPKPEDVPKEIKNTSWKQYVHPLVLKDVCIGGKSPCIKTFDIDKTRDGCDIKLENDTIEFAGHKVSFDDYGQMVGTYKGTTRLRYEKIPYIEPIPKSKIQASKINLFVQVYKSENNNRQKELDDCLKYNKSRDYLNVVEVYKQDRLTFKEMMDLIRPYSDEDTISIFANSDIVFDDTIKHTLNMTSNECFWITRYENSIINADGTLDNSRSWRNYMTGSSDVWVFRGVLREVANTDFGFGIRACDVAFSDRLSKAGYNVFNPCLSIKTYHIHKSDFRNYHSIPRVAQPWLNVDHCVLPNDYSTIIENQIVVDDHHIKLMRKCKQWSREMKTKAWVSIGSINDDDLDFYEPVSKMWKKFGYNTFLTVVCNENSIERTKYGIILRLKKSQSGSLSWQSQISRFYASSYIDGMMIISNIDIMPLRTEYFDSLITLINDENTISLSNEKSYLDDMLWTACNSKTFENILNSAVPFDKFCEDYIPVSDKIRDYSIIVKFMDNIPMNGISRDNWVYRRRSLMNGEYTHATLLTPFKKYHTEITELISVRNKLEVLQNPPERITVSSKKLGCIVYLCDNGREWELKKSLDLLYKNFIPFNPYPVIIFHEDGFDKDDIHFPVEFRKIQFDNTRSSTFENNTYRIGYCHMCDFFSYPIFDILKDEYTYYMRLDTDSFILSPFNRDIFTYMKYGNKKYAYISDGIDFPEFVIEFKDTIKEWMVVNNINSIENIENIPNGYYYYTNFEVCEIDWFVSSPYYSKMYEYIKSTNRIYDRRWGDAPIRGIGLRLFMSSEYITKITDLHYKHKSVFNSPT